MGKSRRRVLTGALAFLILSILLTGLALPASSAPAYRDTTNPTQTPDFWIPHGIYEVHSDADGMAWYLVATYTPTATPSPTDTPTPAASPTATPLPTLTPTPEPTATQESTPLPTVTPGPTSVPKQCTLRMLINVNVRSAPCADDTACPKVGTYWLQGTERILDEFRFDTTDEFLWAHHPRGWSAVYDLGQSEWWVAGTEAAELCTDVQGWPSGWEPPAPIALQDGGHFLVGSTQRVYALAEEIETAKGLSSSFDVAFHFRELNPKITVVCRSLYTDDGMVDGPIYQHEWYNPDIYWAKLRGHIPDGCDYYEYINEWNPPNWEVRTTFEIRMLELLAADGKCGLFGSWNLGFPDYPAWLTLIDVMYWIDEHPCGVNSDGSLKYHGLAIHQPGIMPDWVETLPDSYIRNLHLTHRHEYLDRYLRLNKGYSLRTDFKGPIYVTEMGFENYTIPDEQFTCEEVAAGLKLTRQMYIEGGIVDGYHFWSFGAPDIFYDATVCTAELEIVMRG